MLTKKKTPKILEKTKWGNWSKTKLMWRLKGVEFLQVPIAGKKITERWQIYIANQECLEKDWEEVGTNKQQE